MVHYISSPFEMTTTLIILAVWVDDGLFCGTNQESLTSVISFLREHFDVNVETINHFIGIKISRNSSNRTITLSQEYFVHRILKRFGMTNCDPKGAPADPYTNLSKSHLERTTTTSINPCIVKRCDVSCT